MSKHQPPPSLSPQKLLDTFWRRHPFHDMGVESITAVNKRLILRLDYYSLVITGVTKIQKQIDELPAAWLYERIIDVPGGFSLNGELELGTFAVVGRDIRLIRNHDMAVLIPPIDRWIRPKLLIVGFSAHLRF